MNASDGAHRACAVRPLIKFHKNQPEMQVFASYAHKQEHAEAIKGQYVDAAKRMTAAMMEGPQGEKREVDHLPNNKHNHNHNHRRRGQRCSLTFMSGRAVRNVSFCCARAAHCRSQDLHPPRWVGVLEVGQVALRLFEPAKGSGCPHAGVVAISRILYSADDVRSVTIDFDFIGDIKVWMSLAVLGRKHHHDTTPS